LPAFLVLSDRQRADIGDHDIDTAEPGRHVGDPGFQCGPVRDVDGRTERRNALGLDRGDRGIDVSLIARADADIGALGRECVSDCPTDALGAAGDENLCSLESQIHIHSLHCYRLWNTHVRTELRGRSKQQLRAHIVFVDLLIGQRSRDLALLHDVAALRDRENGVEILLDDDDRRPKLRTERFQCLADML
ncbi:hypothetical protein chiPu_0032600, partial [Chiloscyllium punctatum]|nr:hypothetical protein [Chiloscyllium punctatum]